MKAAVSILGLVLLVAIIGPQILFTVDETQHVVITRFGEVKRTISSPGLNSKVPFIDKANTLDKRTLRIDVPPTSVPDQENQFLEIDAYVRYRIADPRAFRETLLTEIGAASRIGAVVIAELRADIGNRSREEIIGGLTVTEDGESTVYPMMVEGVPTRQAITNSVRQRANIQVAAQGFGVEIVDVRVKRADFAQATEENVFARMRTERDVQAQRLRAEGAEEFDIITADVSRLVQVIQAEAEQESDQLRGEGEGEAIAILAEALEQDPDLFGFLRTLEAYTKILSGRTTVVLDANSDLFKYLQTSKSTQ
jgi:membrane protease subunit HflC